MYMTVMMVAAIVIYLVMMVVIGFMCSKKNKNTDDVYLGGRKLGPLVTAMSAEASDMSAYLLYGRQSDLPSELISTGLS